MTDNAEREAFKKVWPCHPDVYWHETMKRWVTNGVYLLEAHTYNSQWQGWQAGRASGIESSRGAVIDADVRKDWVLAPLEPTWEMIRAGVAVENMTWQMADENSLVMNVRNQQVKMAYKSMIDAITPKCPSA